MSITALKRVNEHSNLKLKPRKFKNWLNDKQCTSDAENIIKVAILIITRLWLSTTVVKPIAAPNNKTG
ncbi:hypothetical protein PCA01_35280 [Pseudoalteromonas carrageenovora]|nr:hypothetical protein PCA01_35280 [Pseudoalteromonas carrageenovora]